MLLIIRACECPMAHPKGFNMTNGIRRPWSYAAMAALLLSATGCVKSHSIKPDSLTTDQQPSHGWYGAQGAADPRGQDIIPLGRAPARELAAGTAGCERPWGTNTDDSWIRARSRCQEEGFEAVDVFLALKEDAAEAVGNLRSFHPWLRSGEPGIESRVLSIRAESTAEVSRQMARLLARCQVVRRLTIVSHGQAGTIEVGPGIIPTTHLFTNALSPCVFAPQSQIQMEVCLQGCGQVAAANRDGLQRAFSDPRYRLPNGQTPFHGLRILMNTELGLDGYERFSSANAIHRLSGVQTERMGVRSSNDTTLEFTMRDDGAIATDIPLDRVPQCTDERIAEVLGGHDAGPPPQVWTTAVQGRQADLMRALRNPPLPRMAAAPTAPPASSAPIARPTIPACAQPGQRTWSAADISRFLNSYQSDHRQRQETAASRANGRWRDQICAQVGPWRERWDRPQRDCSGAVQHNARVLACLCEYRDAVHRQNLQRGMAGLTLGSYGGVLTTRETCADYFAEGRMTQPQVRDETPGPAVGSSGGTGAPAAGAAH